ncbi:hypothetical protein [Nocardia implantans]|uniref:Transposase n=1 Tax=Nocardia implantans TaxID=3108168 RepID=A0ABU6AXK8_9NOCA|nr:MULTISPECIES: hypothetical protein [unclassified Nocardia]MBF6193963.1 hypothetical protein [Nocardia beijingensis]MEA3529298.1 hypothetical protein [Nocardia sp. CDC192]MEB3511884.1 hypothetical protein [Nocardia sp. CDC186]
MEIMNPLLITKAEALPVIKASSRLFYRLFPFDEAALILTRVQPPSRAGKGSSKSATRSLCNIATIFVAM